jgi:adenosylcobyric acid synthase
MTERHGGNLRTLSQQAGKACEEILDFSANINPLGAPDDFRAVIGMQIGNLVHYPDPDCADITAAFAERHRIAEDEIVIGNGSTELLYLLPAILRKRRAVIPVPAYVDYERAAELAGLTVKLFFLKEEGDFALDVASLDAELQDGDVLFLGRPNNPTGDMPLARRITDLAVRHPETYFVVDEAFADFVSETETLIAPERKENIIVLKSLTKIYAMPGLRVGCAVAHPNLAKRLKDRILPWSVNTLAQAVGAAALRNETYIEETRRFVKERRQELKAAIEQLPGLTVYPGAANFLLVRSDRPDLDAMELSRRLLAGGIAIRICDNFAGLDRRFFRVAVRTRDENERLAGALEKLLCSAPKRTLRRKTPAIMFQGTGSNVGKSVLAAAFCRILLQDGFRVAPFKAQNMSLNSFVTRNGGEMGRAQAVQAQASRIDPDVRMNPVLLKPSSDTGSQVIVMGKPVGNMDFAQHLGKSNPNFLTVRKAYDSLAAEYDVIVLEGAGSPAEVNLKKRDIVNMNMALYANAPVLIVGDIDRGGVYASFIGTMECLTEQERAIVKGFIVNRFRGEESFLAAAHDYVLARTGIPVRGVIRYLPDLGLPEEDSVSFKSGKAKPGLHGLDGRIPEADHVDIAVIDLPHISNFTDLDALLIEPDVRLRIVRKAGELEEPDALIVPGSKNVIGDLAELRKNGIADRIMRLSERGKTEIIGICGGFQMMGQKIVDPLGIESAAGRSLDGLGLLPVRTELAAEKTLKLTFARHILSGCRIRGYEIHHGLTDSGRLPPLIVREDGSPIAVGDETGLLWGTYLHGIFDDDSFRRWFIDRLRMRKHLAAIGEVVAPYDLEAAFERLADVVRQSVEIEEIYKIMGL